MTVTQRRQVLAVLLALACLLATVTGWVGLRGVQVVGHLRAATELALQLQSEVAGGDVAGAQVTLRALQRETAAARAHTSRAFWRGASRTLGAGTNLSALRTVTVGLDELAHQGAPLLLRAAAEFDMDSLAPRDGRIDLSPLQRAAPPAVAAAQIFQGVRDQVAAADRTGLLPHLRTALDELERVLTGAARDLQTVAHAATLLPPMLGTDGPRTYLLLFQNSAEVRATGGMPGAFAVVRADNGRVEIVRQGAAAADIGAFDQPVLPLDPAVEALYTDRPGRFPANVNLTPHFPTAAKLAREMYRLRFGEAVDGVLATDPVALSYLLRTTGSVDVGEGPPLTAENAVPLLMSEVYERYPTKEQQHEYLAAVAAASFETLLAGLADPRAAITDLAQAAGERRLLVWSSHAEEQSLLQETVLGGVLPTDDGARPTVGVFLNDAAGSKLSYYLEPRAELRAGACRQDNRRELRVRVTLQSRAPQQGLPDNVLGLARSGDPYRMRTNVSVFSPAGGSLVEVSVDGQRVASATGWERGRAVGIVPLETPPGGQRVLEATLLTAELPQRDAVDIDLWVTPTATPWAVTGDKRLNCS